MSDEPNQDIQMAECGACEAIIPLDSQSCPKCKAVFGDISDNALGECGACGEIQPADSEKCVACGVSFVTESDEPISISEDAVVSPSVVEIEETAEESDDIDDSGLVEETVQEISSEEDSSASSTDEVLEDEAITVEDDLLDSLTEDEDEPVEEIEIEDEKSEGTDSEENNESVTIVDDVDDSEMDDVEKDDTETEDGEDVSLDESDEADVDDSDEDAEDEVIDDEELEHEDESSEEEIEEESKPAIEITDQEVITAFENLALSIASTNMTAAEAFAEIDRNDDGLIDGPEMQKGIENIGGEKLQPSHVKAIMNYLDSDDDNRIDPQELLGALDGLGFGIQAGSMPKPKKVKEFPTPAQKLVMSKSANDIYYPVMYFLFVSFIGLWVVNGMGLLVDGTGGTIEYEGHEAEWGFAEEGNWDICDTGIENMPDPCAGNVRIGNTYPCDPLLDPNKCANSLTIFSGENGASSMPADFYLDGIIMIILGVIGLAGTAYLHLLYAPSLRERAKALKGDSGGDEEQSDESEDEDETDESDEESALDAPVDLVIEEGNDSDEEDADEAEDEEDDDVEDEEDDDVEDEEDDDADEDGEVDIGSWIGLDIEGEEYFGEIIEFDDEEGTVTIETEDGEEITAYQDEMFFDDE